MITFNDFTNGFTSICSQFFVFNSQTSVSYVVRDNCRFDLSRLDLISCIRYFLCRLYKIGLFDEVQSNYKFEDYEYHELSVYLNGLLRFYVESLGLSPIKTVVVVKHSRLPLNVVPVKPLLIVEYATIFDHITHTSRCVSRVNNVYYCSESKLSLVDDIRSSDPDLFRRYNVVFKVVGS